MKLTYLVVFLLVSTTLSYRYLSSRRIQLPSLPNAIHYLSEQLLVTQTGRNITVINTTTDKPVQSFLADSDTPNIQIAPQQNKLLFMTNKSIIQLQQAKTPQTITLPASEVNWIYRLGAVDNYLISHQMSSLGTNRSIYYIDIDHQDEYKTFDHDSFTTNLVAGSNVQALTAKEYYYVSGGLCNNAGNNNKFYLFKGDDEGTANVYNFSVPGCALDYPQEIKLEWDLASLAVNANTRWHALSYVLDDSRPNEFTTHIVQSDNDKYSQVVRFDTIRLIGKEFLNGALYTADNLLCRIYQHSIQNHARAASQDSVLPDDVIQTVVEDDETYILGLTGSSTAYLFTYTNQKYETYQTLSNPEGNSFIEGYFVNNTFVIFKDNASELTSYDYNTSRWQKSTAGQIIDYCTTDGSVVFTITQESEASDFFLNAYRVNNNTYDLDLVGSRVVSFAASDLLCLSKNRVLVNPLDTSNPIRVWQFTSTFTITASQYLNTNFQRVYKTESMIYFTNANHRSTPIFYDYNLNPFSLQGQISIATENVFQVIGTNSDHLLFAVGDDQSNLVSLDYYQVVGTDFKYIGTFPLNNMGLGKVGRAIILPDAGTITLQYPGQNAKRQVSYQLNSPPQIQKGIFEDLEQNSCSFFYEAKFRVNPSNKNVTEMVVINGMGGTPVIERYIFNGTAYKMGSAYLEFYTNTDLSIELSANTESVLASGVKLTDTLADTIQIRSVNNLADVTFEKVYFDHFDKSDIQSYVLFKNNLFTAIVNKDFDQQADHYSQLLNQPNSGGKVSTGDVGQVTVYATCTKCNFLAVVGADSNVISLINIGSGVNQRTIEADASCAITQLSLNIDGTLIAYLCADNKLFVYNTQTSLARQQQNPYTGITEIEILSSTSMLISVGDQTHFVTISVKAVNEQITHYRNSPSIDLDIIRHMQAANADNQRPVIDYNTQSYAITNDPTKVVFNDFNGKTIDTFPLVDGEQVVSVAFAPSGLLSILTDSMKLYSITPDACPTNQSNVQGYCSCDPSFDTTGGFCQCSGQHIYINEECLCEDGKFFVSPTVCDDCSALCSTCSESGVGGCQSYSALFVIMIILIILAVLGIAFGVVWYIRRKKAQEGKANRDSSDLGGKQPLAADKEDD